ncbi:GNAT family N-acetyltransferase [candidate division KSB1 bacterium]|nr:GNAT family N-acetyltransferase [candidate division KSB1 bacterium]
MINQLEEISINSWGALQTVVYDGWIFRFANGVTKRSNSVHPMYKSSLPIAEKVEYCEQLYTSQGLPAVFKLHERSFLKELDDYLEQRQYVITTPTSVQVMDISAARFQRAEDVIMDEYLSDNWLDNLIQLQRYHLIRHTTYQAMMTNVVHKKCYASIADGNKMIGVAHGVCNGTHIGVFEVIIDLAYRRRGFGLKIIEAVLRWGQQHGAITAWLQVECDNEPALNLYKNMGFQEAYVYWYRVQNT